jgi:hypothetical protein
MGFIMSKYRLDDLEWHNTLILFDKIQAIIFNTVVYRQVLQIPNVGIFLFRSDPIPKMISKRQVLIENQKIL